LPTQHTYAFQLCSFLKMVYHIWHHSLLGNVCLNYVTMQNWIHSFGGRLPVRGWGTSTELWEYTVIVRLTWFASRLSTALFIRPISMGISPPYHLKKEAEAYVETPCSVFAICWTRRRTE